jgi:hypothetical protein
MPRLSLVWSLVFVATVSCAGAEQVSPVPRGWISECPGDNLCFSRPPDLKPVPVQVIDSLVGIFEGPSLNLRFELGMYDTSLDHLVKPESEVITIDGRPAQVLTAGQFVVLKVPLVSPPSIKFMMQVEFKGTVSRPTALQIFESIRFRR